MLTWPRTAKRLGMLTEQLNASRGKLVSLQEALTEQIIKTQAAEEKLHAYSTMLEEMQEQFRQLDAKVETLFGSLAEERSERRQMNERTERLDTDREAKWQQLALSLTKLEKRMEQQEADAIKTAAILLARLGTAAPQA